MTLLCYIYLFIDLTSAENAPSSFASSIDTPLSFLLLTYLHVYYLHTYEIPIHIQPPASGGLSVHSASQAAKPPPPSLFTGTSFFAQGALSAVAGGGKPGRDGVIGLSGVP